jgi:hypothetical protein
MKFRTFLIKSVAAFLMAPAASFAATLTMVPMQGTMIMPKFAYHAIDGSLTVSVSSKVPQLIPLSVSNPADNFDPADPWFSDLDPSDKGLSFSRRYGFTMDTASDDLPEGVAIWIRKVSGSLGIDCYDPDTWEPLFGTAGSTNVLYWDTTMYHPAFAALPGTNTFTAQFEGFLINTNSGSVLPGGSSGPITLKWTNSPDGRPLLEISRNSGLVLHWPVTISNYVLEAKETLASLDWARITNAPVPVESNWTVKLDVGDPAKLFRLRRVP